MFQIKICGITSAKDAQFVALAGADGVGLNFYPQSKRFLTLEGAEAVVKTLPAKLSRVGVFVNHSVAEVTNYAERLRLDWIQLHGNEPPDFLASLGGRAILRAFPFDGDPRPIREYLEACTRIGARPAALLVDAPGTSEFGGTGQTVNWKRLAEVRSEFGDLPLVLAGGLTPFNVAEAIAIVRPQAVDVASGVESKPGTKDLLLLRAFVTAAKKALAETAPSGG